MVLNLLCIYINAFENLSYRKILRASWTEHRLNQSISKLILEEQEEGKRDLVRRMWRTGWGQVSGEWDEQQK